MRRAALLLALVAAGTGPAMSADVSIRTDLMGPGSHVVYRISTFETVIHHFPGPRDGTDIFEYRQGDTLEGSELVFTVEMDGDGRWRRQSWPDGREVIYTPHNCWRVLGECTYEATASDGEVRTDIRVTELVEGGMASDLFRLENGVRRLISTGTATLDDMGMMEEATIDMNGNGRFVTVRKLRAVYHPATTDPP